MWHDSDRTASARQDAGENGISTTNRSTDADASLFEEIEACAGRWATEAGEHLAAHARGSLHIEYKGNGTANPVSEADREAEEYLYRSVTERFPGHAVIGEEGRDPGPDGAPFVWVVDPLDGTTNYLNGLALWCVSVGVLWHGVPVAGAIWAPLGIDGRPALFLSRKGGGATVNGRPMHVSATIEPPPSRLAALPASYQNEIGKRKEYRARGEPRTLGTIALELALTACGALQFSAFWIPRIWDVAAGVSLILESGGGILRRETREQPWQPFRAFEAPPGLGLRKWQGAIIAANPELATSLAERVQGGSNVLAPVEASPPTLF
ncbi:MAG: inositol monophosphatase family protein [Dehalococcoidia bacterium]